MMTAAAKIGRNTRHLITAYIGRKLFSFVFLVLMARYAGVATTGLFYLVMGYVGLFFPMIDFGLSSVLVREGSRRSDKMQVYLGNILTLKVVLAVTGSLLAFCLINFMGYSPRVQKLVYLAIVMTLTESFSGSFFACFRACQNMKYEAWAMWIGQACAIFVAGFFIFFRFPVYYLVLAFVFYEFFNLLFSGFVLIRKLGIIPRLNADKNILFSFLRIAGPFALGDLFVRLYSLDMVLLSKLMNETMVAWYAIPSKIVSSFQFIPVSLSSAMFPVMSFLYVSSTENVKEIFLRSHQALTFCVVPVATGIAVLSLEIVQAFFGRNFLASVVPLQIMVFSLVPIFLNHPISALLNACNKQVFNSINVLVAVFVHIGLSVTLIPAYNVMGVAVSAVASNSVLYLLGMYQAGHIVSFSKADYMLHMAKLFIAASVMAIAVIFVKGRLHFSFAIFSGAFVYFLFSYFLFGIKTIRSWFGDVRFAFPAWTQRAS